MHDAILDLVKVIAAWIVGSRIAGVKHVDIEVHFCSND